MDERGDAAVPAHREFRLQAPLLLNTARVLMLLGAATIFFSAAGLGYTAVSPTQQAFAGLLLWLLGVSLLVLDLVPVAAAMAIAVLKHLLALCN